MLSHPHRFLLHSIDKKCSRIQQWKRCRQHENLMRHDNGSAMSRRNVKRFFNKMNNWFDQFSINKILCCNEHESTVKTWFIHLIKNWIVTMTHRGCFLWIETSFLWIELPDEWRERWKIPMSHHYIFDVKSWDSERNIFSGFDFMNLCSVKLCKLFFYADNHKYPAQHLKLSHMVDRF